MLFTRRLQSSICLQYKVVYQGSAIYLSTTLFTRGFQSICLQCCLPGDCNLSVYKVVYQGKIAIYLSTMLFTWRLQSICLQSCLPGNCNLSHLQSCLPEDCNLNIYKVVYQRIAIYPSIKLFTRILQSTHL